MHKSQNYFCILPGEMLRHDVAYTSTKYAIHQGKLQYQYNCEISLINNLVILLKSNSQ